MLRGQNKREKERGGSLEIVNLVIHQKHAIMISSLNRKENGIEEKKRKEKGTQVNKNVTCIDILYTIFFFF